MFFHEQFDGSCAAGMHAALSAADAVHREGIKPLIVVDPERDVPVVPVLVSVVLGHGDFPYGEWVEGLAG